MKRNASTLRNYLKMVRKHPVFMEKHPELVSKLEGYVKDAEEGKQMDWNVIMQFVMMILQLLFHI